MIDVLTGLVVAVGFVWGVKETTFIKATFTEMVKGMRNV